MMDRQSRERDAQSDKAIEEFLANGGKITQCKTGARTEDLVFKGGFYGRKPKKKEE